MTFKSAIRHSGITQKPAVPLGPVRAIWQVAGPGTGRAWPCPPKGIFFHLRATAPRVEEGKKPEGPGGEQLYPFLLHPAPLTLRKD